MKCGGGLCFFIFIYLFIFGLLNPSLHIPVHTSDGCQENRVRSLTVKNALLEESDNMYANVLIYADSLTSAKRMMASSSGHSA